MAAKYGNLNIKNFEWLMCFMHHRSMTSANKSAQSQYGNLFYYSFLMDRIGND